MSSFPPATYHLECTERAAPWIHKKPRTNVTSTNGHEAQPDKGVKMSSETFPVVYACLKSNVHVKVSPVSPSWVSSPLHEPVQLAGFETTVVLRRLTRFRPLQ
jgi:hypothetical protein